MAIQYWHNHDIKKTKIIAFRNGYHGDTFGAMAVGDRTVFTKAFHDLLFEVIFIDAPTPGNQDQAVKAFGDLVSRSSDIAAFIFEPLVQGTAGMIMYPPEPLDKMILLCREHYIISIADEVMTGFGRTGRTFATDYLVNKPDVICLSKGITGGTMPLGVTVCTSDIYNAFLSDDKSKALFHGHSYTANPLACVAAIASMELLMKDECQQQIAAINNQHNEFKTRVSEHPGIAGIRLIGTIIAIELKTTEETSYFSNLRDYLYSFFMDRKILIRPLGNIIYLMPPYCITKAQLKLTYDAIEELLDTLNSKKQH
jgi:adenosylmethionine-8-amino-7-oxononanoate aminotransferase